MLVSSQMGSALTEPSLPELEAERERLSDLAGVHLTAKRVERAAEASGTAKAAADRGRMRWTVAGADAITALRCRDASSQRETICTAPHNQTGAA